MQSYNNSPNLFYRDMSGETDIRRIIEKTLDKVCNDLNQITEKDDPNKIHALEASRCIRLSYYDRKDPLPSLNNAVKVSIMVKNSIRRSFNNVKGEYKVDNLVLQVAADFVNDEFIARFEVVGNIPEIPHPRDLLYLNACLFAFNKFEGILIYVTNEGKTAEFSILRSNKMLEEIIRRARVLNTLLKENKVPIVEPCDLCLKCNYYERCYSTERKTSTLSLESLLGLGKKG
jgi:CRISPR-associated exonuclease Cas4